MRGGCSEAQAAAPVQCSAACTNTGPAACPPRTPLPAPLDPTPAPPPPPLYAATYQFILNDALVTPPITYRYFICLYSDDQTTPATITRRAGASVDVVGAPAALGKRSIVCPAAEAGCSESC